MSFITLTRGVGEWHFVQLYRYQLGKIRALDQVDILLLGDSSLGNGISADSWADSTGQRVLSLPLTGVYGYAGSLNTLNRVLRRTKPGLVVIVHSPDMMARKVSHEGFIHTAQSYQDLIGLPLRSLLSTLINLEFAWQSVTANDLGSELPASEIARWDYVPQGPQVNLGVEGIPEFRPDQINLDKLFYLRRLAQVCRENELRCVYMHGPCGRPRCGGSEQFFENVGSRIRELGIPVVPETPICIPNEKLGDAPDHVAPSYRAEYSSLHLDRLRLVVPVPTTP